MKNVHKILEVIWLKINNFFKDYTYFKHKKTGNHLIMVSGH
jgi:hypothetical protein